MKNKKVAVLGICETCKIEELDMVSKYLKKETIERLILNYGA